MKIKSYRNIFIESLTSIYDALEAESFFYLVLEEKHQLKKIDLALNPDLIFSETELMLWNEILEALKKEIPIQYLLEKAHFYGLEFYVNQNVLIPRPETEELVEWVIANAKNQKVNILDIGTGSGCIAISLAKNLPLASVSAIDVSEKALEVAQKNAQINNVTINFITQNILNTSELEGKYDIIVSNPPYIRNLEKSEIRNNVLCNEPHLALFVENDNALIFYKKIGELAFQNFKSHKNSQLYFEINQYLANETIACLKEIGFENIELRKDIYQNDRMIFCWGKPKCLP